MLTPGACSNDILSHKILILWTNFESKQDKFNFMPTDRKFVYSNKNKNKKIFYREKLNILILYYVSINHNYCTYPDSARITTNLKVCIKSRDQEILGFWILLDIIFTKISWSTDTGGLNFAGYNFHKNKWSRDSGVLNFAGCHFDKKNENVFETSLVLI